MNKRFVIADVDGDVLKLEPTIIEALEVFCRESKEEHDA